MNRKLLIATGLVFFFVVVALVWYFFYVKPVISPSISETNDPLRASQLPPRYQFVGNGTGEDVQTSVTEITQKPEDPLIRVWDKPTTGQTFITEEILKDEIATTTVGTTTVEIRKSVRATTTLLLFVDRATGYIYGYSPDNNSVFQITNTVVAGVHDAYIFNNGKRVIMRYVESGGDAGDTVVGMIANIPSFSPGGTPSSLTGQEYLNSEVSSVATDSLSGQASYIVKTSSGSSVYSVKEGDPQLVTSSPFGEWDLSYGGGVLYATTKPSSFAMGITTKLPSFSIVVGEHPGLMIQPSSSLLLGSSWQNGTIGTFLVGESGTKTLATKTLASKCGWSGTFLLCGNPRSLQRGGRDLPDAWFQGLTSFDDDLVYINTSSLEESPFFNFDKKYGAFDIISLVLSKDTDFVSFINKKNGELWLLKSKMITGE